MLECDALALHIPLLQINSIKDVWRLCRISASFYTVAHLPLRAVSYRGMIYRTGYKVITTVVGKDRLDKCAAIRYPLILSSSSDVRPSERTG